MWILCQAIDTHLHMPMLTRWLVTDWPWYASCHKRCQSVMRMRSCWGIQKRGPSGRRIRSRPHLRAEHWGISMGVSWIHCWLPSHKCQWKYHWSMKKDKQKDATMIAWIVVWIQCTLTCKCGLNAHTYLYHILCILVNHDRTTGALLELSMEWNVVIYTAYGRWKEQSVSQYCLERRLTDVSWRIFTTAYVSPNTPAKRTAVKIVMTMATSR